MCRCRERRAARRGRRVRYQLRPLRLRAACSSGSVQIDTHSSLCKVAAKRDLSMIPWGLRGNLVSALWHTMCAVFVTLMCPPSPKAKHLSETLSPSTSPRRAAPRGDPGALRPSSSRGPTSLLLSYNSTSVTQDTKTPHSDRATSSGSRIVKLQTKTPHSDRHQPRCGTSPPGSALAPRTPRASS